MGRKKRKTQAARISPRAGAPVPQVAPGAVLPRWWPFAVLLLAVAIFYWSPLTSAATSIQWDAVDVHYSPQKYFADHVREGRLPFWTPYVHCGFPFLADPQVGAWYPLNWPFFLAGITPKAIELEIALHALIAAAGAYLLGIFLLRSAPAALGVALLYALSGFFAGHSSHVGMFQGAAWLPWLLLAFLRSLKGDRLKYAALAGAGAGLMGLAGHFQTALYGLAALAIVAGIEVARKPRAWRPALVSFAVAALIASLVAAIVILPGLELTRESIRARVDTSASRDGALDLRALGTLVYPNLFGAVEGAYTGPGDATQYYFYAGMLLVPLAAFGLKDRRVRVLAAVLWALALWYALGPDAGLYRVAGLLPGFRSVRAPVHGWFVAALGMALLAGAGIEAIRVRWGNRLLMAALLCVLFADLYYWNSSANRLAYARASFEELYGRNEAALARVAATQPPLTRFLAPDKMMALGPMNGPLDVRLEATYGYNPLELRGYSEYRGAASSGGKLVDGLNVSRKLNRATGSLDAYPVVLPRAYFPQEVFFAQTWDDSRRLLASVRPPESAVVLGPPVPLRQDASNQARIVAHDEQTLRIHCRTASESMLRVAVPYYPGWHATSGGSELRVVRADHAFLGLLVPAGEREIRLEFRPNYFGLGAALSLAGMATVGLLFVLSRRRAVGGA